MKDLRLGPALLAEALGSFILVFAGCGAIAVGTLPASGVAAAFGLAIMVSIYAFGHVSGAHFNPAVTLAFAVGRHVPARRVPPYWIAQCLGAIAAAGLLRLSLGSISAAVTAPAGSGLQSFAWEVVLTFVLMLVVVAVATDSRAVGQGAAIPIGGAVALASFVGGPISGASMNPARSLGPALVAGDLAHLWIYLTAPFVGATLAVGLYRLLADG
ncbi:MAG: MIP family channel protein [Candidatus Limnocylindrales bacterium]